MYNVILERIHQVVGNLVLNFNVQEAYVDKNDPWTGILAAAEFSNRSTTDREKGYSLGQLVFGRDMILPIKHRVDWELIRQQKKTQLLEITPKRINIDLTTTIKSVIISCSLNRVNTNMRLHIKALL